MLLCDIFLPCLFTLCAYLYVHASLYVTYLTYLFLASQLFLPWKAARHRGGCLIILGVGGVVWAGEGVCTLTVQNSSSLAGDSRCSQAMACCPCIEANTMTLAFQEEKKKIFYWDVHRQGGKAPICLPTEGLGWKVMI